MSTIQVCTAFGFQTDAGIATGNVGNRILDSFSGTAHSFVTGRGGTGTTAIRFNKVGASAFGQWTTNTLGASNTVLVGHMWVKADSETGTPIVYEGGPGPMRVKVDLTNNRLRFEVGGGTAQFSPNGSLPTSTWTLVEWRYDVSGTTYTCEWQVSGTPGTNATLSGQTASTIATVVIGSSAAETVDFSVTDVVISVTSGDYPLGSHKVVFLKPDTGGSLDVSTITTSEWNTFAGATPTLSAWNATTALAAVDEVPVGLGASADGFCRITGTDADYVGVPMTSYTISGGETIVGMRMLACCWAATTTAALLSFDSYNGTTATTLFAAGDPNADNSTTPAWVCKMCTIADFDTQSELDELQFRVGCTDSTPDAGIHAIYAEAAVRESTDKVVPQFISQYGSFF